MKRLFIIIILIHSCSFAQTCQDSSIYQYIFVEEVPKFGNDVDDLKNYLDNGIKSLNQFGILEKVVVSFVVNNNGKVADVDLLKANAPLCAEIVSDLLYKMPAWKPGKHNGKTVSVRMYLELMINNIR